MLPALACLDRRIESALALESAAPTDGVDDADRGLYVTHAQVRRLLAQDLAVPWLGSPSIDDDRAWQAAAEQSSRLRNLSAAFELTPFDQGVLLLALAPELDLRYERIVGFLQDDVTRRLPTVDLALNLLCESSREKLARRSRFTPDAPLVRHGLVRIVADPMQVEPPLLSRYVTIDAYIANWLLGQDGLDPQLGGYVRLVAAQERDLGPRADIVRRAVASPRPLHLVFDGPCGAGKSELAAALAAKLGCALLRAELGRVLRGPVADHGVVQRSVRQAALESAVLYLDAVDITSEYDTDALAGLLEQAATHRGITILAINGHPSLAGTRFGHAVRVPFDPPDFAQRRSTWQFSLRGAGVVVPDADVNALAARFRLTPGRIEGAVRFATRQTHWESDGREAAPARLSDLFVAARAQSSQALGNLARKLSSARSVEELVLPADRLTQLRELANCVRLQALVQDTWGFKDRVAFAGGMNALFAGPSGTGKTLAAEVIAHELGLDLFVVDLSAIMSKYIG